MTPGEVQNIAERLAELGQAYRRRADHAYTAGAVAAARAFEQIGNDLAAGAQVCLQAAGQPPEPHP